VTSLRTLNESSRTSLDSLLPDRKLSNSATLLDLSTILPSKPGVIKIQRESSLPMTLNAPVLRYSHENKSNGQPVVSRLESSDQMDNSDKEDGLNSPEGKIIKSLDWTDSQNEQRSNELSTMADRKWHLDVSVPSDRSAPQPEKEADPIEAIVDVNNPKSILKPKVDNGSPESECKRKSLDLSTCVLPSPPAARCPPPAAQTKRPATGGRRRITRRKEAKRTEQEVNERIFLENFDGSSDTTQDSLATQDSGQTQDSKADSNKSDLSKSVRFCPQGDKVKEYLPWEAPNSSIIEVSQSEMFYRPYSGLL